MPGLRRDGLVAGASYYDAQVAYPERIVVELVRDAVANGAKLVTYTRVTRIASERGAVTGSNGERAAAQRAAAAALVVVNAAGPWVDEVLGEIAAAPPDRRHEGQPPGRGAVSRARRAAASTSRPAATRGRCSSCRGTACYLIGTTDERFDGDPSAAAIDERELAISRRGNRARIPGRGAASDRACSTRRPACGRCRIGRARPKARSRAGI